jgi:hypothetical protein
MACESLIHIWTSIALAQLASFSQNRRSVRGGTMNSSLTLRSKARFGAPGFSECEGALVDTVSLHLRPHGVGFRSLGLASFRAAIGCWLRPFRGLSLKRRDPKCERRFDEPGVPRGQGVL